MHVIREEKCSFQILIFSASPPIRLKKFCPELRKNALLIGQSYASNFALYIITVITFEIYHRPAFIWYTYGIKY